MSSQSGTVAGLAIAPRSAAGSPAQNRCSRLEDLHIATLPESATCPAMRLDPRAPRLVWPIVIAPGRLLGSSYMTPDEKERYSRQILFPAIGEAGQSRIQSATVAIVG